MVFSSAPIGNTIHSIQTMMIMELLSNGDLRSYLISKTDNKNEM